MRTSEVKIRATWDDDASRDADRTFNGVKKELDGVEKQAKLTETAFRTLGTALVGFASIEAVRRIGMMALEMEKLASRAAAVEGAFQRMASSRTGNPAALMKEIDEATRGTLSNLQMMIVANTALSSGIEPLYKNLGAIIRDIRSVSTALGRDATEDIERVISAINKQEQELLDELGIVARAETAYKNYAEAVGKSAAALSDLEKREAFAGLVIDQLRQKAQDVGRPIDEAAEATARLAAEWENFQVVLGKEIQTPAILNLLSDILRVQSRANQTLFGAVGGAVDFFTGGPNRSQVDANAYSQRRNPVDATQLQTEIDQGIGWNNFFQQTAGGGRATHSALMGKLGNGLIAPSYSGFGDVPISKEGRAVITEAQGQAREAERARQAAEREAAKKSAKETAEAERALTEQRIRENRIIDGSVQVVSRIVPQLSSFASAVGSLVKGDMIGAAFGAINGVLDLLGVAGDEHERYARKVLEAVRSMEQAVASADDIIRSVGGAAADELKGLQYEAIKPIMEAYEILRDGSTNTAVEDFRTLLEYVGSYEAKLGVSGALREKLGLEEGQYINELMARMSMALGSVDELGAAIEMAFGSDTSIIDAAARIFDVEDAFESLSDTLSTGVDDMTAARKAVGVYFDAEMMAARMRARDDMISAGSDPFAQGRVLLELERSLDALVAAERAKTTELRSSSSSSSAAYKAATGGGTGSTGTGSTGTGGGTSGTTDPFVFGGFTFPETTINLSDFVTIEPLTVDEWSDILNFSDIPGRLAPITIGIEGQAAGARDLIRIKKLTLDDWSDFLNFSTLPGRLDPITIGIENETTGDRDLIRIKRLTIDDWGDLLQFGGAANGAPNLPGAINLSAGDVLAIDWSGLGVDFNYLYTTGLMPIAAAQINPEDLVAIDWSGLVESGGAWGLDFDYLYRENLFPVTAARIAPVHMAQLDFNSVLEGTNSWGLDFDYLYRENLFPVTAARININDMVTVSMDEAWRLDFDAINYLGFLEIIPARLKLQDIIDLDGSDFMDMIRNAVNRLKADRKV